MAAKLIGGDTTKGPLTISITVFGEVPPQQALRRDAARAGDDIWSPARWAMRAWRWPATARNSTSPEELQLAARACMRPPARGAGPGPAWHAHAAIDISDGLAATSATSSNVHMWARR
jgi:thiamine-monophosphate kinase